jgi:hypothetical protein
MSVCYVPTAEEFEVAAFDRLQPQLERLWDVVFPGDEQDLIEVSQFGKFGVIAIGNNRVEADQLFNRCLAVLDHETGRRNDA